jgi:hypothetical protein
VTLGFGTAALLVTAVRPLRRPALDCVRTALTDVRLLHTRPSRILALWGGSAATPLLQGSVIATVGFSLGLPLSWAQVILALLLASTAVGAVPAPGGIGPVDAALVFTMVAFGAPMDRHGDRHRLPRPDGLGAAAAGRAGPVAPGPPQGAVTAPDPATTPGPGTANRLPDYPGLPGCTQGYETVLPRSSRPTWSTFPRSSASSLASAVNQASRISLSSAP